MCPRSPPPPLPMAPWHKRMYGPGSPRSPISGLAAGSSRYSKTPLFRGAKGAAQLSPQPLGRAGDQEGAAGSPTAGPWVLPLFQAANRELCCSEEARELLSTPTAWTTHQKGTCLSPPGCVGINRRELSDAAGPEKDKALSIKQIYQARLLGAIPGSCRPGRARLAAASVPLPRGKKNWEGVGRKSGATTRRAWAFAPQRAFRRGRALAGGFAGQLAEAARAPALPGAPRPPSAAGGRAGGSSWALLRGG